MSSIDEALQLTVKLTVQQRQTTSNVRRDQRTVRTEKDDGPERKTERKKTRRHAEVITEGVEKKKPIGTYRVSSRHRDDRRLLRGVRDSCGYRASAIHETVSSIVSSVPRHVPRRIELMHIAARRNAGRTGGEGVQEEVSLTEDFWTGGPAGKGGGKRGNLLNFRFRGYSRYRIFAAEVGSRRTHHGIRISCLCVCVCVYT